MPELTVSGIVEARETFHILHEIARLLNTDLDADTLMICVRLCEAGVNPEALAMLIKDLKREATSLNRPSQFEINADRNL